MINKSILYTVKDSVIGEITDGVAVSGAADHYSKPMSGENASGAGIQLQWTGTPTGTFTLWLSDKPFPILTSDADWYQDTTFTPTNPAGSASKMGDTFENARAKWWRIKYAHASGSGSVFGWYTTDGRLTV